MESIEELREKHGEPSERAATKVVPFIEPHVQEFIENSPFAVLATSNEHGDCDASPKGGKPGFVKLIDNKTLLLPEILGNRLFQSYQNIQTSPKASLIFFIPGNDRCVRVNGRVKIIPAEQLDLDSAVSSVFTPDEKTKYTHGIILTVDEAYSHCPRALKFSNLWGLTE